MTATIHAFPFLGNGRVVRLNAENAPCRVLILPVIRIERETRPSIVGPTMKSRRQRAAQEERLRIAIEAWEIGPWWS